MVLALALAYGCGGGGRGTFILLPDPDGRVGEITVTSGGTTQVVDQAWQGVEVAAIDATPSEPEPVSEERVRAEFESVITAQPAEPAHFILHFEVDSTELTAESKALLPEIVAEITRRRSVDTSVVGHTDTLGSKRHNYELSLRRAQAVAALLLERQVPAEILEINSHGEEDPLVPTVDQVDEPRNRRVEITVR